MKRVNQIISLCLIVCLTFFQISNLVWAQEEKNTETPRSTSLDYYLAPGADNQPRHFDHPSQRSPHRKVM